MQRFGAFVFDAERRQLSREGADVHLTPKAFDLLVLLLGAAPRVVSKKELHEHLWPRGVVSDATLVGLVKELRRALGDRDSESPLIRTVPRVGYAFGGATTTATMSAPTVSGWLVMRGTRIPLRPGENTVGRDPSSTVRIDAASVSRRHARIVCSGTRVVLEDAGSKNGTTVGAEAVSSPRELREGDRISFGHVEAMFWASESSVPTVTVGGDG
jgi:DNA-binding winged helix-turn-helix (wHTH) protein